MKKPKFMAHRGQPIGLYVTIVAVALGIVLGVTLGLSLYTHHVRAGMPLEWLAYENTGIVGNYYAVVDNDAVLVKISNHGAYLTEKTGPMIFDMRDGNVTIEENDSEKPCKKEYAEIINGELQDKVLIIVPTGTVKYNATEKTHD